MVFWHIHSNRAGHHQRSFSRVSADSEARWRGNNPASRKTQHHAVVVAPAGASWPGRQKNLSDCVAAEIQEGRRLSVERLEGVYCQSCSTESIDGAIPDPELGASKPIQRQIVSGLHNHDDQIDLARAELALHGKRSIDFSDLWTQGDSWAIS